MSRFLLRAILASIIAWLLGGGAAAHAAGMPPSDVGAAYAYDGQHASTNWVDPASERGPPAATDCDTTYDAVRREPQGALVCPADATTPAAYDYDDPTRFAQVARGSRVTDGPSSDAGPSSVVVEPSSVAANAGRVFTSADAHVAGAANAIEAALPGRVVGVNGQRTMANGLTREVDIDLGNLLVQVKSGNARGLTGQIGRTQSSTGVPTIGYAPGISDAAWRNAASQGIPILRSPGELLAYIREFG